jgi:hypothetical protein
MRVKEQNPIGFQPSRQYHRTRPQPASIPGKRNVGPDLYSQFYLFSNPLLFNEIFAQKGQERSFSMR